MSRDISPDMQAEIEKAVIRPVLFVELDFLSAPVRLWNGIGPFDWDGKTWTGAGDLLTLSAIEEASDGTATSMTGELRGVPSDLTGAIYQDEWQGRPAYAWLGMMRGLSLAPLRIEGDPATVAAAGVPYEWFGRIRRGSKPYVPALSENAPAWMQIEMVDPEIYRVFGTPDETGVFEDIVVSASDAGLGELIDEPVMIRQGIMDTLDDLDDGKQAVFRLSVETEALDQGNNRAWRLTHEIQQQFFPGDMGQEYTSVLQAVPLRWGATTAPVRTIRSLLTGAL